MKTAVLALGLVLAFAMVPASTLAEHETSSCELSSTEADVEAGGLGIFIDYLSPEEGYSIWIYQESNDLEGFQRSDSVVSDELCGHDADTVIF